MSHAFWEWSLTVYDDPAVRTACLGLQDRHGLNVNVCLWCAWLASEGRDARPVLPQAVRALEPWSRDITRALRKVRRDLKEIGGHTQLYKAVLACELDAEHAEQDTLFALAADALAAGPGQATAEAALTAYARLMSVDADFEAFLKPVFLGGKKV